MHTAKVLLIIDNTINIDIIIMSVACTVVINYCCGQLDHSKGHLSTTDCLQKKVLLLECGCNMRWTVYNLYLPYMEGKAMFVALL